MQHKQTLKSHPWVLTSANSSWTVILAVLEYLEQDKYVSVYMV